MLDRVRHKLSALIAGRVFGGTPVSGAQLSAIGFETAATCSERLLDLSLRLLPLARSVDLTSISDRIPSGPRWPDVWPGEHYRLLVALVQALRPKVVVEIGTFQGLSALALERALPEGGVVHTFDVVPWQAVPGQALRASDLESGRIVPCRADLADPATFERHRELIASAELIFVDAAKDGRMERAFLERFESVDFKSDPIIVFDDIRVLNMIGIWNSVTRPRLDLTSFGHWSGTGLIDWNGRPRSLSA